MKKAQGILSSILVLTILIANIGLTMANSTSNVGENGRGYTTLDEPIPKRN